MAQDFSPLLYIWSDESLSNQLATIEKGKSQEFTLDGNTIYAGFTAKYGISLDGTASGCTVNWKKNGDFYCVCEIEITSSPASCSLKSIL